MAVARAVISIDARVNWSKKSVGRTNHGNLTSFIIRYKYKY
jgi:hypothetical protein